MNGENLVILSPDGNDQTKGDNKNKNSKRPSIKLYVPKQRRSTNDPITTNNTINDPTTNKNEYPNFTGFEDPSIVGILRNGNSPLTITHSKDVDDNDDSLLNNLKNLSIKSTKLNGFSDSSLKSSDENLNFNNGSKETKSDEDWFNLYTDSGDLLNVNNKSPQNIRSQQFEILDIKESRKSDEKKIDYLKFEPNENLNLDEYGHVIEIYDFPIFYKNENILNAFKDCLGHQELEIKWVDDTHCLGVFSNATQAINSLKIDNALLKVRPLSMATSESKEKAKRMVNYLKPYKPRPQTTSFVASRLITSSLGIGNLVSKEKLKLEKSKLDTARDKKKKDKEIREAVWNGN